MVTNHAVNTKLDIAAGSCIKSSSVKSHSWTFGELKTYIGSFPKIGGDNICDIKAKLPYFIAGNFTQPTRRDEYLTSRSAIVYDVDMYDNSIELLEKTLIKDLEGVEFYAYSTISHTLEKPRIRIVLPLDTPIKANEYRDFTTSFAKRLNFEVDKSSFKPNQLMFCSCIPIAPGGVYEKWDLYNPGRRVSPINDNIIKLELKNKLAPDLSNDTSNKLKLHLFTMEQDRVAYKNSQAIEDFNCFERFLKLDNPPITKNKTHIDLCLFGECKNKSRKSENILALHYLVLDFDGDEEVRSESELLELVDQNIKHTYILHSTARSTKEKPRCRIIIPLIQSAEPKNWKICVLGYLNTFSEDFKRGLDIQASLDVSHIWRLPFEKEEGTLFWKRKDAEPLKLEVYYGEAKEIEYGNAKRTDAKVDNKQKKRKLELDTQEVVAYLDQYPAVDLDYHGWLKVLQGIHHQYEGSDEGLRIAVEWSSKDNRNGSYLGVNNIKSHYRSFSNAKENVVTFASVTHQVRKKREEGGDKKIPAVMFPNHEVGLNGNVKPRVPISEANLRYLLSFYNIKLEFEEVTAGIRLIEKGTKIENEEDVTFRLKTLFTLNGWSHTNFDVFIPKLAKENKTNLFRDCINSTQWDGVDRWEAFYSKINCQNEELIKTYMNKMIKTLVVLNFFNNNPQAMENRQVFILQGEENIGKSTFVRSLLPVGLEKYYYEAVGVDLSDSATKKGILESLVTEFCELDSTLGKRTDFQTFKGFISMSVDNINIKYEKNHRESRRHTVFWGTTNALQFLSSVEEHTRFLVLRVDSFNFNAEVDMNQLYAQCLKEISEEIEQKKIRYNTYALQKIFELSKEERTLAKEARLDFQYDDPIEGMFLDTFEINPQSGFEPMRLSFLEIYEHMGYSMEYILKNQFFQTIFLKISKSLQN